MHIVEEGGMKTTWNEWCALETSVKRAEPEARSNPQSLKNTHTHKLDVYAVS